MEGRERTLDMLSSQRAFNLVQTRGGAAYDLQTYIPFQMRPIIECSPMREHADYYWWRAVSATFIARPNRATLDLLASFAPLDIDDFGECISMFVRHGDKVGV
jgi:hypothetical protein